MLIIELAAPTGQSFAADYAAGEIAEFWLDAFFAPWFRSERATREEDRGGTDRFFWERDIERRRAIQYKAIFGASRRNGVFLEYWRNDRHGPHDSWALESPVDRMIVFVPRENIIFHWRPGDLVRAAVEQWIEMYPTKLVVRRTYTSRGVIVPLQALEQEVACIDVMRMSEYPHWRDRRIEVVNANELPLSR